MYKSIGVMALLVALPMMAHASSCENVKSGIDAKLKAHGVGGYTLDIVWADKPVEGGKVVGKCDGDKQILYTRDAAAAPPASDEPPLDSAKNGADGGAR